VRCGAGEPRRHLHALGIGRKVHQRAPFKLEDRLAWIAVASVLLQSVVYRLPSEGVLELHCGHRNAVETQRHVERLFGLRREAELARDAQPVRRVAGFELRVQLVGRLEVGNAQGPTVALEAVPQRGERAVRVHPLAQVREHLLAGLLGVERFELGPFCGLGLSDECEHGLRKYRAFPIEGFPGNGQIAMSQQVSLDDGLEGCLGMSLLAHAGILASR